MEYVDERVTGMNGSNDDEQPSMFVCTEIAAAESIEGLNYTAPRAN